MEGKELKDLSDKEEEKVRKILSEGEIVEKRRNYVDYFNRKV